MDDFLDLSGPEEQEKKKPNQPELPTLDQDPILGEGGTLDLSPPSPAPPAVPSLGQGLSTPSQSDDLFQDDLLGPAPQQPKPVTFQSLTNPVALRNRTYEQVLKSASSLKPISNNQHTLRLDDVAYEGPEKRSLAEQKKAIVSGRSMNRRLVGTWTLIDNESGQVLDQRRQTVAQVPMFNNQGVLINKGTMYSIANQMRLKPGAYARVKDNGMPESHFNLESGTGRVHRYSLEPSTGVLYLNVSQSKIPLLPLMKILGATGEQMQEAWGPDVYKANTAKKSSGELNKIYQRMARPIPGVSNPTDEQKSAAIREAFEKMRIDPDVSQVTLGAPHDSVTPEVILKATRKLIDINRKEAEPDDRDSLAFKRFLTPDDLFAERIAKDAGGLQRQLLQRATREKSLKSLKPGALTAQLNAVIHGSGLGQAVEQINPIELLDKMTKITSMGTGGLGSIDAIPLAARSVQPSHMGFIDPSRTPESLKVGIDLQLASGMQKGSDGKFYAPFIDAKSGERTYRSTDELQNLVISTPDQLRRGNKRVRVFKQGQYSYETPENIDLLVGDFEEVFSPIGNLVPLKSGIKAQRMSMASRMLSQALPIEGGEAPYVQTLADAETGQSYENQAGVFAGAQKAAQAGRVLSVEPDAIKVQYEDGTTEELETYNYHASNRKTYTHNTPLVKPGDTFTKGQTLAKSNYTDDRGTLALGRNLRTAYVTQGGMEFEDAVTVSESAAREKLVSQHMYSSGMDLSRNIVADKNAYIAANPDKYERSFYDKYDDSGVIKPGEVVKEGDPLVLALKKTVTKAGRVHGKNKQQYEDISETWKHHHEGTVTDVFRDDNKIRVFTRSFAPLQVGDKLCYSHDFEALTEEGWKSIKEVQLLDKVASRTQFGCIEYIEPIAVHSYPHQGQMYSLETEQVSLCLTEEHNLFAAKPGPTRRCWRPFAMITAKDIANQHYKLCREGIWRGKSPKEICITPSGVAPEVNLPIETYATLLGVFLSSGRTLDLGQLGKIIRITRFKTQQDNQLLEVLSEAGLPHEVGDTWIDIYNRDLWAHLNQLGSDTDRAIPAAVFQWHRPELEVLFSWLMWGEGTRTNGYECYRTRSKLLADDMQRLALHIGFAATIKADQPFKLHNYFWVLIHRKDNQPEVDSMRYPDTQSEQWIDYDGDVYCVQLPRNHVLYVRRKGKPVWCGNSGLRGDKGIVSQIKRDEDMPVDSQGRPVELLLNPHGLVSRTNPSQILDTVLGKLAEARGEPYKIKDFDGETNMLEFLEGELKKHGLSDLEDLTDPRTGKKIPQVLTGSRYFLKLHHLAECYDEATEVLTHRGWVYWRDVLDSDLLMTVDNGQITYEKPLEITRSYYAGEMYGFSSTYVDYLVTPNHRMYLERYHGSKGFQFLSAEHVHKSRFKIKQFGFVPDVGGPVSTKTIGNVVLNWDDYCELSGWWASEGSTSITKKYSKLIIYQSESANPGHCDTIRRLFDRIGVKWHEYRSKGELFGFVTANRDLAEYFHSVGTHCYNKRLPRDVIGGPVAGRQAAYDAMMHGDGNVQLYLSRWERARYSTTSKQLADDFQELSVRLGFGAIVRPDRRKEQPPHHLPSWTCGVSLLRTTAQVDGDRRKSGYYTKQYDGMVYCATMRTGLLYVRRNGKPMLCGNSKQSARGLHGSYTQSEEPGKSDPDDRSKRFASLEVNALQSHSVPAVQMDASVIRGQRNDEYWIPYLNGETPPRPKVPKMYETMVNAMIGSGINVVKTGTATKIMGLTDADVQERAGDREVKNSETVKFNERLDPITGGLFDPKIFGDGTRWGKITLQQPLPNPVFEDPIRIMLGLTKNKFEAVISGKEKLGGSTGPAAIQKALNQIDVGKEIGYARKQIESGRKTYRDAAIRKLRYLKGAETTGVHPKDWMLSAVPVLPPAFRPISMMEGSNTPLVADSNMLYKELMEANENWRELAKEVDDTYEEAASTYQSFKALTGLADPVQAELRDKNVKGLLSEVFGTSPKHSKLQAKLLGSQVNLVGRAVIAPDPSLDIDSIAIPEKQAWKVYEPTIRRRLRQRGMKLTDAAKAVEAKSESAKKELLEAMRTTPVIMSRAPVWHKFGVMAYWPTLTKDDVIKVSPLGVSGPAADFDGDTMQFHVPIDEDARKQAIQKMLPSANLLSPSDFESPMYPLTNEYAGGVYSLSTAKSQRKSPRVFQNVKALRAAYVRGDVEAGDPVQILED